MDESVVREVAHQVVSSEILLNWRIYAVLALVQGVVVYAASFLTKYAEKRGEAFATKADFEQILLQLQKSTEAAESIKTTLAHKDWTEKEYKLLRRIKLEELLTTVHLAQKWQNNMSSRALVMRGTDAESPPDIYRLKLLCVLYFPEFQAEVQGFHVKFSDMEIWVMEVALAAERIARGTPEYESFITTHLPQSRVHILELHQLAKKIELKAAVVMSELIAYR